MAFSIKNIFNREEDILTIFEKESLDALSFYEKDEKTYIKTFEL